MLSAVFLEVVEVGDGEGYWVRGRVLREDTMAVAIRAASMPAPKNEGLSVLIYDMLLLIVQSDDINSYQYLFSLQTLTSFLTEHHSISIFIDNISA